jgi:hypothetical protein
MIRWNTRKLCILTDDQVEYKNAMMCLIFFFLYRNKSKTKEQNACRMCRCGFGVEKTAMKCDTPGMHPRQKAEIKRDLRGYDRVELPRKEGDRWVVQSSMFLAQAWRANCDLQILLYDSDPDNPEPEDVGRVTDYIVAYQCKGNETYFQERKTMTDLILHAKEKDGSKGDVRTLARQLLNSSVKSRVISKQECMCLLIGLKLYDCSETIETVSISGEYKLGDGNVNTTVLSKYAGRPYSLSNLSLNQFFFHQKVNKKRHCIPHYVGGSCDPVFPATEGYARSVLIRYRPWIRIFRRKEDKGLYVPEFLKFLGSEACPDGVKVAYARVKARHEDGKTYVEPTATVVNDDFTCDADAETRVLVDAVRNLPYFVGEQELDGDDFDFGHAHDWGNSYIQVSYQIVYPS